MSAEATRALSAQEIAQRPIATIYARALLAAAQKAGQTETVLEELSSLVDDVLPQVPALEAMLASKFVDYEVKARALDRGLGGRASRTFLDGLKVLARHERLDCLAVLRDVYRELYEQANGRVRVSVRTAVPLTDAGRAGVLDRLRALVQGEPVLSETVDPDLLGGIVVRVGDMVYDGSLATQLEQVRSQILERSVHEIQSRRDRFSHSARD